MMLTNPRIILAASLLSRSLDPIGSGSPPRVFDGRRSCLENAGGLFLLRALGRWLGRDFCVMPLLRHSQIGSCDLR